MSAAATLPLADQFEHGLDAPICLTWELTYACNLACVHCLSSSGRRDPRELTTSECKAVPARPDGGWASSRRTGSSSEEKEIQHAPAVRRQGRHHHRRRG